MAHTQVVETESEKETETYDSDDSQQDPSFHILEETRSKFSDLSIKKKPTSRVPMELDEEDDCTEITAPKLDANEEKSFEIVQKIIEDCQVEKLKVEQCKLYLRRHGLRLTGKKDILIQRIKEHISIMNGEGEHKYPASTFVMNCKGDACTGDVVMFEQNVYEMFNIASRSASGPPCGQRIVAGRIVKESYGAAKQQHTFTIEVLWSKGTKPLPPLYPLLIKGRNLYRLKTMRQRWEDESQRQKILSEKHARGNVARTNRDARLHEKEMKKTLRAAKGNIKNGKQEEKRPAPPINSSRTSIQRSNAPYMAGTDHGASYKENTISNTLRGPDGPLRKSFQVEQNMKNEKQENKRNASPTRHPRVPSVQHAGVPFTGVLGNRSMDHGAPYRENMNPNTSRLFQNMGCYSSRLFQRHDYDHQNRPKSYSFQQASNNGYLQGAIMKESGSRCRFYPIALKRQANIESFAPNLSYAPAAARVPDNEVIVDPKKQELISRLKNGKNFLRNQNPDKAFPSSKPPRTLKIRSRKKKAARGLGASMQRQGKYKEAIKYHSISEREAFGAIADCYTELGDLE